MAADFFEAIRDWVAAQRPVMQFAHLLHVLLCFPTRFFHRPPSSGVKEQFCMRLFTDNSSQGKGINVPLRTTRK